MWNTVLALNRFSAIVFYFQYKRLWNKRKTTLYCILLLFYPFVINLYKPALLLCNFLGNNCPHFLSNSYEITDFDKSYLPTFDFVCAITATLVCIIAVICQVLRKKGIKSKIERIEIILLTQSLLVSTCLVLSATFSLLASLNGIGGKASKNPETLRIMNLQMALSCISEIFYALYHYSALIVLFALS